jgi:hypothetical protein
MSQTWRQFWGPLSGRQPLHFEWSAINAKSTVIITASEYKVTSPYTNEYRMIGDAPVWVESIAPRDLSTPGATQNGVDFVVNIDYGSNIYIVTDITLLTPPIVGINYYDPPATQAEIKTSASAEPAK